MAVPSEQTDNEEREYLLWAEAKQGKNKDIYASLVQLILTISLALARKIEQKVYQYGPLKQ